MSEEQKSEVEEFFSRIKVLDGVERLELISAEFFDNGRVIKEIEYRSWLSIGHPVQRTVVTCE